eukprot:15443865-Alexandrium_andersonii.AAC.1
MVRIKRQLIHQGCPARQHTVSSINHGPEQSHCEGGPSARQLPILPETARSSRGQVVAVSGAFGVLAAKTA